MHGKMELIWGCGQGDGMRQIGTTGESGRLEPNDFPHAKRWYGRISASDKD
jgi:hypothetical protein